MEGPPGRYGCHPMATANRRALEGAAGAVWAVAGGVPPVQSLAARGCVRPDTPTTPDSPGRRRKIDWDLLVRGRFVHQGQPVVTFADAENTRLIDMGSSLEPRHSETPSQRRRGSDLKLS